jgi:hypothetical protein
MPNAIRKLLLIVLPCVLACITGCTIDQLGDVRLLHGSVLRNHAAVRAWSHALRGNASKRPGNRLRLSLMRQV